MHGLLRITVFVRYVFLGALNNLVLVKSLDLRVKLTTLLRLILIDSLYTYLKGLVNFLFLAPYWACGVHRPRCIYIAFLHLVLVDVVDWVVCFLVLLIILNFHALAESTHSFYALLLFQSWSCVLVTHDFLLGDEERFWPLRFTVFILAVLLYVFNNVLYRVVLEHFIEVLTV